MHSFLKTAAVTIALTLSIAACDAMSGRETPGAYVDDTVITSKVIAAIVQDEALKKSQVSVETMENVVQLSGFVDNAGMASRAGDLARKVVGVRAVRNNLVVQ
jgi:hyperosmotically inducible periplasmic protein